MTGFPAAIAQSLPAVPSPCTTQSTLPATIPPTQYSPDQPPLDSLAPRTASLPSSENPGNACPAHATSSDSSTGAACIRESDPSPYCRSPQQSAEALPPRGSVDPPSHPPAIRLLRKPLKPQTGSVHHSITEPDSAALHSPHHRTQEAAILEESGSS